MINTVFTVTDTNTGESYAGDLYDAVDWMRAHWLTDDVPDECRKAFEDAVDRVEEQMENASYNERRRVQQGLKDWPDPHSAPDAGWARTYLGLSVSWETK